MSVVSQQSASRRPPRSGDRVCCDSVSTSKQPRLTALGDLLLDVVVSPERPIERGTDVPGSLVFRRGGSASNSAAVFAHLGGAASLITSLGDDFWASRLLASLRADGVRVHAARHPGVSGRLAALIDERGERSFVTQRGAADALEPDEVDATWLRGADALHVPAYSLFWEPIGSAAVRASALARDGGSMVSSDLSSQGPLLAFGIRKSRARITELAPDVLFANRDEAAALLHETGRRAWVRLLDHAALVVVKDGLWGCRVLWEEEGATRQLDVAATRIGGKVDTTGAGDAFAAGFLYSLLRSGGRKAMRRDQALRRAAMAGHKAAAEALRRNRPEIKLG
jgi:sugar/nucleoside kinase (ribokinase family)